MSTAEAASACHRSENPEFYEGGSEPELETEEREISAPTEETNQRSEESFSEAAADTATPVEPSEVNSESNTTQGMPEQNAEKGKDCENVVMIDWSSESASKRLHREAEDDALSSTAADALPNDANDDEGSPVESEETCSTSTKLDSGAFSSKCPRAAAPVACNEEAEGVALKVRAEPIDLHWVLKTANPDWTSKELKSAKSKLKQVGIESYADLEDVLNEKGVLNNRLRQHGLKAFGPSTLDALRKAIASERERQRQAALLVAQRERRRLEEETKAAMVNEMLTGEFEGDEGYGKATATSPAKLSPYGKDGWDLGSEPLDSFDPLDIPDLDTVLRGCESPEKVRRQPEVLDSAVTPEAASDTPEINAHEEKCQEAEAENSASLPPQVASPCIKATQQSRRLTGEAKKERMLELEREMEELKAKIAASPAASPAREACTEVDSDGEMF